MREIEFVPLSVSGNIHGANLLTHCNERAFGIRARDADQLLRLRIRKRAKENAADQTEDGGVRPNAKRERKGRDSGEADILVQLSQSVPEILNESRHHFSTSYSYRSAVIGCTCTARRAGTEADTSATTASASTTKSSVHGSRYETP